MYIGDMAVWVSVCGSVCLSLHSHTIAQSRIWRNGKGCPLVVHCWADLQLVHVFRCYDNIAPNAKCQRVLVLALVLFLVVMIMIVTFVMYMWITQFRVKIRKFRITISHVPTAQYCLFYQDPQSKSLTTLVREWNVEQLIHCMTGTDQHNDCDTGSNLTRNYGLILHHFSVTS